MPSIIARTVTARIAGEPGRRKSVLALLAASTLASIAAPVMAQQDSTDTSAEDRAEILVTARRRAENIQNVPIAISIVGGKALEQTGARGLDQIKQLVPSLQILGSNPRNTNINIRGLGTSVGTSNDGLENGVGVYIDDVYYGRPGQAMFDLFDIDRVEVLRGPQGTLFGKNTTAGAISITTRGPSFDTEGNAEASLGDDQYRRIRASIAGPLVDGVLAYRVSGSYTKRDGQFYNSRLNEDTNDLNRASGRGQLLFTPSSNFKLLIGGDYSWQKENCCATVFAGVAPSRIDGTPIPNNYYDRATRAGYISPPVDPFALRTDTDVNSHFRMSQGGASGKADLDLGSATLTSVTAFRYWHWDPVNDGDSIGLPILSIAQTSNRQKQFSQELRIASNGTRTIDYVAGLYYFHQRIVGSNITQYGSAAPNWVLGSNSVANVAAIDGFTTFNDSASTTDSYAGFGQVNWHISPALSLTAGLRYTHEKKSGDFAQTVSGGADLSTLPLDIAAAALASRNSLGRPLSYDARETDNSLSGLATLSYQVSDDVLAYATYSRGSKSGGLNLAALPTVEATGALQVSPVVNPEKVTNYEAGIKSQFLDRKVTLNLAAFWTESKDYQTTVLTNTFTYISNVGKVRARGVEFDLRAQPAEGLTFYGSGIYNDAKILSYPNSPCPIEYRSLQTVCDLSGKRLPGTSKWSLSAGADVSIPVVLGLGETAAYAGVDYSYRSSFFNSNNDSIYSIIRAYSIVNARLGIRADNRVWDLSVWARNLFDEHYYENFQPGSFNSAVLQGRPGEPRTVGVTLRSTF